jgi:hypothetical protein
MSRVQITFYDELVTVPSPTGFAAFKEVIAEKYFLDPVDVDELIMYYINEHDRVSVYSESDYQQAIFQLNKELVHDKNYTLKFFLQVSEQSRLYKKEFESSKVDFKIDESILKEKERLHQQELLRKEIAEKEALLKEMLEKEALDKENKEKERLEKEKETQKVEALRERVTREVTEKVNQTVEKMREDMIKKAVEEELVLALEKLAKEPKFLNEVATMRLTYDLKERSDDQILAALEKTNGNMEEALTLLF